MITIYSGSEVMATIPDLPSSFNFMGEYDSNLFYNYGSVCTRNGEVWVFDGQAWHSLGSTESHMIKTETKSIHYIVNCPNCGAPMKNHKCIYCGTEDYGKR